MNLLFSLLITVLALRGLFIPVDILFFRNTLSHGTILAVTLLIAAFFYKKKYDLKIPLPVTVGIGYLLLHAFFVPSAILTNLRYCAYILICVLIYINKINLIYIYKRLIITISIYTVISLIIHLYHINNIDLLSTWAIADLPIFHSNNDVYNRYLTINETCFSPFYLLLIRHYPVSIGDYVWYRYIGFGPEPTDYAQLVIPLIFVALALNATRNNNKKYNIILIMPLIIGIIAGVSVGGIISTIAGGFFVLITWRLRDNRWEGTIIALSFSIILFLMISGIIDSFISTKIMQYNYYSDIYKNINLIGNMSAFGIGIEATGESSYERYGSFGILTSHGYLGMITWLIIISYILYNSYYIAKTNKYFSWLAGGCIASLLISVKTPDIINLYLCLYFFIVKTNHYLFMKGKL